MFTVALTGGIGSGKSTVAEGLAALGAGVVDTDRIAHALVAPGCPLLDAIAAAFGPALIRADGSLDRPALRVRVFDDPAERARLEAILHPSIRERMLAERDALRTPYAVLVIPLLFETGQESLADRVLVVDLPESLQIERVCRRSGLDAAEVSRIISSQIGRRERIARADDLIDNSGPPGALAIQIAKIHDKYLELAVMSAG